jgi:hydroxymethylglutaryl-CoA reductase (NADPH)
MALVSRVSKNGNLTQQSAGKRLHGERDQSQPKSALPAPPVPGRSKIDAATLAQRWRLLDVGAGPRDALVDPQTVAQMHQYQHNVENFIGTVKLPVGLAGPLLMNGLFARGEFYLPLATTEAALVASYSRGAQLISRAGGCTAMLLSEKLSRTPGFVFGNLQECGRFAAWAMTQRDTFSDRAAATTRYGRLVDMHLAIEGNHIYLNFEFLTGDASGQNMVTIATQAICSYIDAHSPVRPQYYFLEANMSGDKKASARALGTVRGKKVSAELFIPGELVQSVLHTTPARMVDYWRISTVGGVLSGTIGVQGHYANGLAALYLACGQDVACVAESAVGVTRFEVTAQGQLYASVTLPNLLVGTVGGGTKLPSQRACLDVMGLAGPGSARALAEVCAGLCLAGELSIAGAMCAGDFAQAHQALARGERE